MGKPKVDYSLYLVTDSTPAILGDRRLIDVVKEALGGGVTVVQLREKTGDTAELISKARELHALTQSYGVPLLINDRVDVALAVGCEGIHIGQDDMELSTARKLLGPDAIIGVTVSTVDEALKACEGGADYLGIGTVYATPTKTNTKEVIGAAGVREILARIDDAGHKTQTVCIGGINESNLQRIVFQCGTAKKKLDGVAIVSAIMAAEDPDAAATRLGRLLRNPPAFQVDTRGAGSDITDAQSMVALAPSVVQRVHETTPLSHNMTNIVVQNIAANVALAVGASPIMAGYGEEAPDLCKLGGALVINMGSVDPAGLANYLKALRAYNLAGRPVVFDPVGAGATSLRREAVKTIMANGYLDVIKGNEGEIKTVFGNSQEQQRGVDSSSTLDASQKAKLVRELAAREKNVVVMTGKTDFVSDGVRTFAIDNGHEYLGLVTGTGCTLGTVISAAIAPRKTDRLGAVVAAILHFEIAAELAASQPEIRGPGTFVPAFLDELYRIRLATAGGDLVCDIQEKFRTAIFEFDKVVFTTNKLLQAANALQIPIFVTTQNRARLGDTVQELQPLLKAAGPLLQANLDKTRFSMWLPPLTTSSHFSSSTKPRPSEVAIVGIESHICVTQTALDLLAAGHSVYVLADGVSSANREEVGVALARLRQAGAVVTTSESWIYECMGDAAIPEFKGMVGVMKEAMAGTREALQGLVGSKI
ncbi:putative hydroxyethylthiazole kinase [Chaetomidium leptoderma]|uniref:Hydroxyethylthiazole kinase n=1 Tax=Chaetomidium leptoderma TaxID=669021 RepID=A0AAN6VUA1_9PEZI|nr:putative hydroxyethylthiazole kinase [Chaetomidium leptoderma]